MSEFIAGRTVDGRGVRVRYGGGVIEQVDPDDDAPDLLLSPGLIDLQVNGYGGVDFNADDTSVDEVAGLVRRLWRRGITAIVPTVITADRSRVRALVARIRAARDGDPVIAQAVPGIHLEGPYLSAAEGARGAHDPAVIRDPSTDEFADWQAAAGGLIMIMTLAPERHGAIEFTGWLVDHGVIAAMGHSSARSADVAAFAAAGGSLSTHLGNGLPALIDRHDHALWPQLDRAELTACFIADGQHLPAEAFRAMVRAKGTDRSILVSDAAALAGCAPGDYQTPVGGTVTVGTDGRLTLTGTPYLAGSGASLDQCVRWAIRTGGLPVTDALRMATAVPARIVGLDRGTLRVGARADLVCFARDPQWGIGEPVTVVTSGVTRIRDGLEV